MMKITKDYLDKLIIKNTRESGEIFTLLVDFGNTNIDIVNVVDSEEISNETQVKYQEAIEYYFTMISNTSDFFEELEKDYDGDIITFDYIKINFVDESVDVSVETYDEKTKEILMDYFTKYQEEFSNEDFTELYDINVINGETV